jgi:hypothetical protein
MQRLRVAILTLAICSLASISVEAQSAPTRAVTFRFDVPVGVKSLHPEIVRVTALCTVYTPSNAGGSNPVESPSMLVSALEQNSGPTTITASKTIYVPADAGGKQGTYSCLLKGSTATGSGFLSPTATDPRFRTDGASAAIVSGHFTW